MYSDPWRADACRLLRIRRDRALRSSSFTDSRRTPDGLRDRQRPGPGQRFRDHDVATACEGEQDGEERCLATRHHHHILGAHLDAEKLQPQRPRGAMVSSAVRRMIERQIVEVRIPDHRRQAFAESVSRAEPQGMIEAEVDDVGIRHKRQVHPFERPGFFAVGAGPVGEGTHECAAPHRAFDQPPPAASA